MTPPGRPVGRDGRAVSDGSKARLLLLVVLILAATQWTTAEAIGGLFDPIGLKCLLAAGGDPNSGRQQVVETLLRQPVAVEVCSQRWIADLPYWWLGVVWSALVLILAVLLFYALPGWKSRRRRVVDLSAIDDGSVAAEMLRLSESIGSARAPRVVVNPTAATAGAEVFGRNSRPVICLHGGLLVCRQADPDAFRAVVLHELAHIRNRDLTITFLTVALWRVFLVVALAPYATLNVLGLIDRVGGDQAHIEDLPSFVWGLLLVGFMLALVYSARADILRRREFYADSTAVRAGADPSRWNTPDALRAASPPRRGIDAFLQVWRTHPRWSERRSALSDGGVPREASGSAMFSIGAAAALLAAMLEADPWTRVVADGLSGLWNPEIRALIPAVFVATAAGTALCRSVLSASGGSGSVPSGTRAGIWLGAGVIVGDIATHRGNPVDWVGVNSGILLIGIPVGILWASWTTRCAQLWTVRGMSGISSLSRIIVLGPAALAMWAFFAWWPWIANLSWSPISPVFGVLDLLELDSTDFPGRSGELFLVSAYLSLRHYLPVSPLALCAITGLWVVPLIIWVMRPDRARKVKTIEGPACAKGDAKSNPPLPSVRMIILCGTGGGIGGWIAVFAVQVYASTWRVESEAEIDWYVVLYIAAVFLALSAAMVLAAFAAARLGPFRLLHMLISVQFALAVSMLGAFVLISVDGCVPGVHALIGSCGWAPGLGSSMVAPMVAPGAAFGVVVVACVLSIDWAARQGTGLLRKAVGTRWSRESGPVPDRTGGTMWAAVVLLAAGFTCVVGVTHQWQHPGQVENRDGVALAPDRAPGRASDSVRASRVLAWSEVGGNELVGRLLTVGAQFVTLGEMDTGSREFSAAALLSVCRDLDHVVLDAQAFFRIPEPKAQELWQRGLLELAGAGAACREEARRSDPGAGRLAGEPPRFPAAVWESAGQLAAALSTIDSAIREKDAVAVLGSP